MRLVFLGTPEAAVPALQFLHRAGHEIPLVVTRPDRPVARSRRPVAPRVKQVAGELGIEVFQPKRVRNERFRLTLAETRPDILVVVAYGRILPRPILDLARLGAVNLHFSLLPAYRGAAPVQWALAQGETVTGVTTMCISEGLDEGDILLQREIAVEEEEHAPALEGRLASIGADLLLETLQGLESGTLEPRSQRHSEATFAPIIRSTDAHADPQWSARKLAGRIRGFDPWPGVWMLRNGKRIRLLHARVGEEKIEAGPPGTVLKVEGEGLWVACGEESSLILTRLQPEGRRPMSARDAVNGRQLVPGDRLEPLVTQN